MTEDVLPEPPTTLNPQPFGNTSPRHEVDTHALKVLYSERLKNVERRRQPE